MQYVRLLVPDDRRDEARALFRERGTEFVVLETEAEGERTHLFAFPFPEEGVRDLFAALSEEAGLDDDQYRVVSETETVTGANERRLREAYDDEGVPPEELLSRTRDLDLDGRIYAAMTLLSTAVATAGLLRSSAAALVGAMVIAPFFGSSLAATTGLCCGDREVLTNGVRSQVWGLCLAVVGAAAVGYAARSLSFVSAEWGLAQSAQFALFSGPSALSTLIAVAAGATGGLALASVAVEHGVGPPVSLPSHVTVTLFRGEGASHPNVDGVLRRETRGRTGRDVTVEIRYLPVETVRDDGRESRAAALSGGRSGANTQTP